MKATAIVAAGGVGKRLGTALHKPFVPLCRRPILYWTLRALEKVPLIGSIVLVVHQDDVNSSKRLIGRFKLKKIIRVVPGGSTRTESVFRGLQALPQEAEMIVIHDGARPLVTPKLIEATLKAASTFGAAVAAIPVVPTVKEARGKWVKRTLNRDRLWAIQTPQAFRRSLIEEAYQKGKTKKLKATDDAALVELLGHRVRIVMGDSRNIKVTTSEDLVVAEALLRKNALS